MSDAFAQAAEDLASDPNLGAYATYHAPDGGEPVTIRLRLSRPEDQFGVVDGPRQVAIAANAIIAATALPARPAKGGTLVIGETAYAIMDVMQDARGASWTCALRRA